MHFAMSQRGFTLIEMIVALAVFSVVITISVGALLSLIATNEQLQSERTVMTNLSFALDSMTREIRTGTAYYCISRTTPAIPFAGSQESLGESTNDCVDGNDSGFNLHGISFLESGDSISGTDNRILYYFNRTNGDADEGKIMRRVGDAAAQSIVSSGIYIENADFFVSGSSPLGNGGSTQVAPPTVTIFIEARERKVGDLTPKSYYIQTTVVQRTLDI